MLTLAALMTSLLFLITKVSLPMPATSVSMPMPEISVSLPLLAVITLFSVLPVSVSAELPRPVRFCTLLASAMDTDVFSVLLPVLAAS